MVPVARQFLFYNLKDWASLTTATKRSSSACSERDVISQKDSSQVAVSVERWSTFQREKAFVSGADCEGHLWTLSAPSAAVVAPLCFTLEPQLQPGQVHGCYLNDVLILVKQFCVWLNRGSVSQESQY